jgi:hypothetical protein
MADPTPDPVATPPAADPAPPVSEDSYELVKQACAMAIQDAVAYLRNTELIANAVIGVASQRLLSGEGAESAAAAIAAASASVLTAAESLGAISAASANTLKNYPQS